MIVDTGETVKPHLINIPKLLSEKVPLLSQLLIVILVNSLTFFGIKRTFEVTVDIMAFPSRFVVQSLQTSFWGG